MKTQEELKKLFFGRYDLKAFITFCKCTLTPDDVVSIDVNNFTIDAKAYHACTDDCTQTIIKIHYQEHVLVMTYDHALNTWLDNYFY